ncbi:MAG TPA: hypothetical protein VF950_24790 [Planctomycetota bacterium]
MRIRSLPLWVLLIASCSEPPPPPPPPPTPAQRLDKGVEKLRKLADEQLAAAPNDAQLQLWAAAFKGGTLDGPSPLAAVLRASATPADEAAVKAVEEALPGSSHASLFRARWILLNARQNPDYWKSATEAVEEALKRNKWDCPVRAFDLWSLEWLEKHEPDPLVRACFQHRAINQSRLILPAFVNILEGLAAPAGPPRIDAPRVAKAARRLIEERLLKSPEAVDFLLGHWLHPRVLEAQFLLAWRAKDLETARSASLAVEDYGRRDGALASYRGGYLEPFAVEATLATLFKAGALKPPFPSGVKVEPLDVDTVKEALKEADKGAKAYVAARKSHAARTTPFYALFEAKLPARSNFINYLGQALRDRDFLFTDAYPKDRHEQFLDAACQDLKQGLGVGEAAYGWVIRENLVRTVTIPSKDLARRFSKDKDEPNFSRDMDLFAILKARGNEAVSPDRRPSPAAVVKEGKSTHGYVLLLRAALKAKPADALEWLPEVDTTQTPSAGEVAIAETLRAATEKDFGLDWARWKAFLEAGR